MIQRSSACSSEIPRPPVESSSHDDIRCNVGRPASGSSVPGFGIAICPLVRFSFSPVAGMLDPDRLNFGGAACPSADLTVRIVAEEGGFVARIDAEEGDFGILIDADEAGRAGFVTGIDGELSGGKMTSDGRGGRASNERTGTGNGNGKRSSSRG